LVTSPISLVVEGNWGLFGYSYGGGGGSSGSILFVFGASVPVCKSGRGIGCSSGGGGRGGNGVGMLKIIGSRRLFFVRVMKPDRIGPLIRSGLAANISSFDHMYYSSSFIIVYRVFAIVLVPLFCCTNTPLY
jgi:hypothetical protein